MQPMVHALRASRDHRVWRLARSRPATPTPYTNNATQMVHLVRATPKVTCSICRPTRSWDVYGLCQIQGSRQTKAKSQTIGYAPEQHANPSVKRVVYPFSEKVAC